MDTKTATQAQSAASDLLNAKTSGYAMAYAYTAIFNALLVLLKENVHPVFQFMVSLGHHWVTHGVLDLIVFFGLGIFFTSQDKRITGSSAVNYLIWSTIIGGGIIALFNLRNFI